MDTLHLALEHLGKQQDMRISHYKVFTLAVCPATLVCGHLLSYGRWSQDLVLQTDKDGWLNAVFVKRGWFWTSLVGWWCAVSYNSFDEQPRRSILRYVVLTVWWYVFTQGVWFGIAPIMDLVFTLTGGSCRFDVFDEEGRLSSLFHDSAARRVSALKKIYRLLSGRGDDDADLLASSLSSLECALNSAECDDASAASIKPAELNRFIHDTLYEGVPAHTSAACRAVGGHWAGGHDPSGHIFLSTLMIMYLLGELRVFGRKAVRRITRRRSHLGESFVNLFDNGALWNVINKKPQSMASFLHQSLILPPLDFLKASTRFVLQIATFAVVDNPIVLLVGLLGMWWWSFLVTSVAFHTLSEQISGLAFAYLVAGAVYWNDHWFIDTAMR